MADDLHDSYRILQLEPGASLPAVKRAYRHLVKMWHPDHFAPGSKMELKAQEKLKEINRAYERLCKSRGQQAGAATAAEQHKQGRKSASPSEEAAKEGPTGRTEKAEEGAAPPRPRERSHRMADTADEEAKEKMPPPAGTEPPPAAAAPAAEPRNVRPRGGNRAVLWSLAAVLVAALALGVMLGRRRTPAPPGPGAKTATDSAAAANLGPAASSSVSAPESDTASLVPASPGAGPALAFAAPPSAPTPAAGPESASLVAGAPVAAAGKSALPLAPAPPGSSPARPGLSTLPPLPTALPDEPPERTLSSFTVGATKAEVIQVQGMPDRFTADKFQYGSSEVLFRNGRVESWQDGNPRLKARKPAELSARGLDTFTIGSRKDEVLAVQGPPDAVTPTSFRYGSSVVVFAHDRVESWREGTPRLKTRALSSAMVDRLSTFTVGSRKDEVVEVQGLPESFTETTFHYGSSTVFFQNGRVASWVSGDPALHVRKP